VLQEGKLKRHYQSGVRETLTTVFRRKWLMAGVFIVVVAAMTAFTFATPDVYQSESQILVLPSRESRAVDPAVVGPRSLGVSQSLKNQVLAHREILMSRYVAEKALERVGVQRFLNQVSVKPPEGGWQVRENFPAKGRAPIAPAAVSPADMEEALKMFSLRLSVSEAKESNVLNLSLESEDPQLACDVLGELIQAYLERSISIYAYQAPPDFFVRQITSTKDQLDKKVGELGDFRSAHRVGESEGLQQEEVQQQISQIRYGITEARSDMEGSKRRIDVLENSLKSRQRFIEVSTIGRNNPAIYQYRVLAVEMKKEIEDLAALYPEDERLVVAAREKLKIVEQAIANDPPTLIEVQKSIDVDYDALNNDLTLERAKKDALEARQTILEEELKKHEETFSELISNSVKTNQLALEVSLLTKEYSDYRDNLLRATVFQALDTEQVSNVSVLQPPTAPNKPVSPNRVLNVLMGVVLGLLGGLAAAFTRDFLDQSLKTNEDVEQRLNLPVLVAISLDEFKTCT